MKTTGKMKHMKGYIDDEDHRKMIHMKGYIDDEDHGENITHEGIHGR